MQLPTFFEGPEKKIELVVAPGGPKLRALGEATWHRVVELARAQILSVIRDERCDAYLLSESSLFVYDDHVAMITCGRTRLVDAAEHLVERIGVEHVALLVYERKNEHFPERQPSTFYEDAERLHALVPGRALRFGDEHAHHVHVFHSTRPYEAEANDSTLEILMHGLRPEAAAQFIGIRPPANETIAERTGITKILPGFSIDEHAFTPAGYSMNALRDGVYYTIHVTPEDLGSYVSFETNADLRGQIDAVVARVLDVFRPRSFDVVTFAPAGAEPEDVRPDAFLLRDRVAASFGGYDVDFRHFSLPREGVRAPVELPL
ncbi:MAG: adenosylmethionine decarboxylase [Sandaracinus sp.]|nr:adenosylmethionine decarboxylase [Sandaracinus sp.]MCB9624312.1 adenosylmethionine decarboxylase [Sandaracinus sp.]